MPEPLVEPYEDFGDAARAVYAMMAGLADVPAADVLQRLLASLLATELRAATVGAEPGPHSDGTEMIDERSGLSSRRAWLRALAAEEDRCQRYGIEAGILVVQMDGADDTRPAVDAPLLWAARAILGSVRPHDLVARTDDETISILATHRSSDELADLAKHIRVEIEDAGVMATVGSAVRDGRRSLHEAWEVAASKAR